MARLTELASGGGCGCKIAPDRLRALLSRLPESAAPDPRLLVGPGTRDDAAVYRIDGERALIATTDFFSPVVDDPFTFGRIAATNALSDVYAMGGRPLFALSLLAVPSAKLEDGAVAEILRGGSAACEEAGIPVAGGHSIESAEPIYGLAVTGMAKPEDVRTNAGAKPGDVLVLGKPLGIGVFAAAIRKGVIDEEAYGKMLEHTLAPNRVGAELAEAALVNAMTDVTGFGLLGHLAELCEASGCGAFVDALRVPLIPEAIRLAREGIVTGASARNWRSVEGIVRDGKELTDWHRALLADPQTSGGLLVTCPEKNVAKVCDLMRAQGHTLVCVIGRITRGEVAIRLDTGKDA